MSDGSDFTATSSRFRLPSHHRSSLLSPQLATTLPGEKSNQRLFLPISMKIFSSQANEEKNSERLLLETSQAPPSHVDGSGDLEEIACFLNRWKCSLFHSHKGRESLKIVLWKQGCCKKCGDKSKQKEGWVQVSRTFNSQHPTYDIVQHWLCPQVRWRRSLPTFLFSREALWGKKALSDYNYH